MLPLCVSCTALVGQSDARVPTSERLQLGNPLLAQSFTTRGHIRLPPLALPPEQTRADWTVEIGAGGPPTHLALPGDLSLFSIHAYRSPNWPATPRTVSRTGIKVWRLEEISEDAERLRAGYVCLPTPRSGWE